MEIISIIIFVLIFVLLLAILLATAIFLVSTVEMIFIAKVPFVPVPKMVLPEIIEALKLTDRSILYDLGCGDARVLVEAARASKYSKLSKLSKLSEDSEDSKYGENSKYRFIGIEKVALPLFLAKFRIWRSGNSSNILLKNKNLFKEDLSQATHIFTYLLPKAMDDLLPKLERELKPGTRLISCDFKFSNKEPTEIIDLKRNKKLGSFLYIYEF